MAKKRNSYCYSLKVCEVRESQIFFFFQKHRSALIFELAQIESNRIEDQYSPGSSRGKSEIRNRFKKEKILHPPPTNKNCFLNETACFFYFVF